MEERDFPREKRFASRGRNLRLGNRTKLLVIGATVVTGFFAINYAINSMLKEENVENIYMSKEEFDATWKKIGDYEYQEELGKRATIQKNKLLEKVNFQQ